MTGQEPVVRPARPFFSSGPCAKHPGWAPEKLYTDLMGRSHRSKPGKARLKEAIDRTKALLELPEDYRVGIVPASDTGAVEMTLWSMLGARPTDIFAWESFGKGWVTDVVKQLKLKDARVFDAPYGELPDLRQADFTHDVVFVWNGTTSGVRVPNGDWIPADREGLTICDATSAVFAQDIPWDKIDVATFSWQKVLGGEGGHGILILSPRAVERLESYTPPWPLPKVFRMLKGGKLNEGIFVGSTINTPSMLATEDYIDALKWGEEIGGLKALCAISDASLKLITEWVEKTDWVDFLATVPETRSNTSVCLKIVDPWFLGLADADKAATAKKIPALLGEKKVAYDMGAYRDAPPGLRVWCGATVGTEDIKALLPWLDYAWAEVRAAGQAKAA